MVTWISDLYSGLGPIMQAVLTASWQASVLAVMVLGVQAAFGRWLSARWRYALWSVVVVRLLLPVTPGSAVSVFNLFRGAPEAVVVTELPSVAMAGSVEAFDLSEFEPVAYAAGVQPVEPTSLWSTADIMLATWLAGAALVLGALLLINGLLALRLRRGTVLNDPRVLELVETCKQEMGVRRAVRVYEDAKIASPALAGMFRPTLLMPVGLLEDLPQEELRFILLHELAHIKKHDIAQNWLFIALNAIHWFNPVVWFAFSRLRADRELARDAMVLRATGTDASQAYGQTIIRVLERLTRSRLNNPALAGIGDGMGQLKRRLRMIALSPKRKPALTVVGVALLATLAAIGLTDAAEPVGTAETSEALSEDGWAHVGRLVDEMGQPIVGAELFVGTPTRHISIRDGRSGIPGTVSLLTVEDGRFWIRDEGVPFSVFVIDDRGYAQASHVELSRMEELILQPWSRVEGLLALDGVPVPGDRVQLDISRRIGQSTMYYSSRIETSGEGTFVFEQVPPGEVTVGRLRKIVRGFTGMNVLEREQTLHADPGQSKVVAIGGEGFELSGRFVVEYAPDFDFDSHFVMARLELAPAIAADGGQTIVVDVANDGSLHARSVPPGDYALRLEVRELIKTPPWGMSDIVLEGMWPISVSHDNNGGVGDLTVGVLPDAAEPVETSEQPIENKVGPDQNTTFVGTWKTLEGVADPVTIVFEVNGQATIMDEPNPVVTYQYQIEEDRLRMTRREEDSLVFTYQFAGRSLLLTHQGQTTEFVRTVPEDAWIEQKLREPMRVDFNQAPFEDVVHAVRDQLGVPVFANWPRLKEAGIESETRVTLRMTPRVPGDQMLRLVFQKVSPEGGYQVYNRPTFRIIDGVVNITTERDLISPDTRVYDIRHLLLAVDPDIKPGPLAPRADGTIPERPAKAKPTREELVGQIATLIRETVGYYEEWEAHGGDISSVEELNGNLIIKTSPSNHGKIPATLAMLGEKPSIQFSFEFKVLLAPSEWLEETGIALEFEELEGGGLVSYLDDPESATLMKAVRNDPKAIVMAAPHVRQLEEKDASIVVGNRYQYVSDYKQVGEGDGVSYEPVMEFAVEGVTIEMSGRASSDLRQVTANIMPKVSKKSGPIRRQRWEAGPTDPELFIEQPDLVSVEDEFSLSLPDKGTALLEVGSVTGPMNEHDDTKEGVERRVYVLFKPTIILDAARGGASESAAGGGREGE